MDRFIYLDLVLQLDSLFTLTCPGTGQPIFIEPSWTAPFCTVGFCHGQLSDINFVLFIGRFFPQNQTANLHWIGLYHNHLFHRMSPSRTAFVTELILSLGNPQLGRLLFIDFVSIMDSLIIHAELVSWTSFYILLTLSRTACFHKISSLHGPLLPLNSRTASFHRMSHRLGMLLIFPRRGQTFLPWNKSLQG